MPDSNPIALAFESLIDQWVSFAEDERARLLLWQATPDETPLIDLFIGRESDVASAQTPDLFIPLTVSFSSDQGHGFALAHELGARYEQAAQSFDADDRATRWHAPCVEERGSDVGALVSVLGSLRKHHTVDNPDALLAIWLEPAEVSSFESYVLLPQIDKAWHLGMHGLQFALSMDEATRKSSTLPYLADQLVRITTNERDYSSYQRPLEEQLSKVLGPDWRDQPAQTKAV